MSDQMIKVLEYLGDKLGIAVDWTAENIIPYAEQLFKKYVTLKITCASIGTFIGITLAVTTIILTVKVIKGYTEYINTYEENFWWEDYGPTLFGLIAIAVAIVCGLLAIFVIGCNASSLVTWIIIPEIPFAKEVAALLGTAI